VGARRDERISGRQICARSALIHHVQQEHVPLTVVLEFLQILARWRALNLKELDLVGVQRFRNLLHEVEDEDALIERDALSTAEKPGIVSTPRKQYVPDQVDDLF
jgi:hypothetical protein